MKYTIIAATLLTLASVPAMAHHMSPADPEIGDMQGRHEAAIEAMLDRTSRPMELDELRSDNVGTGIDTADAPRGDDS